MKKYLLRLPEENFEYISKKAEKENLSVNEYINKIIENDISEKLLTEDSIEMKRLIKKLETTLNDQIKSINDLNNWYEINTNILFELLGVEKINEEKK
ncbi:hypothetical protein [Nosocomiicoccus sp. HMSC09A07]|uniref:hypothetical protein n=1 Tax=Nosocomiicoccus sp. HMSC09A07 TaxID=1581145 RepID=UPI0008A2EDF3|nr:hypothetical protein [Nosocomiicoccus sp. HMSC09A07]OFS64727.1 hypothetical protein HMPREF3177_00045 [Nosocomiicoccus sp. HMSC09A07]